MKTCFAMTTVASMIWVILSLSATAHAQTADLLVRVTDEAGLALGGATISVRDADGSLIGSGFTDVDGIKILDSLPSGTLSIEVAFTGFEKFSQVFTLEAGQSPTLTAKLRDGSSEGTASIIVPRATIDAAAVVDLSVSEPDANGISHWVGASFSRGRVDFGSVAADGSLAINQSFDVLGLSDCVMTGDGTRAYVAADGLIRTYERAEGGNNWDPVADLSLPGEQPGDLSLSPADDLLQAVLSDGVEVFDATGSSLNMVRAVPLDSPLHTASSPSGDGYATAADGVFTYQIRGNDTPRLIDEVRGTDHIAAVADRGPVVGTQEAYNFLRELADRSFRKEPLVVTSRHGVIVSTRRVVPYAGTRSTEPKMYWADSNQAKVGRITFVLDDEDAGGGSGKSIRHADDPVVEGLVLHLSEIALRDFELTERLPAPEDLAANSAGTLLATFPFQNTIVSFHADPGPGCLPGPTTACTLGDRFQLEIDWRDFEDQTGPAMVVPGGSEDSELFYFFSSNNWEMLVKTLDGCGINNHYWVFAAATTNVEYNLRVTDTETGATKSYTNPLGVAADAITDTQAFECGDGSKALRLAATESRQPAVVSPVKTTTSASDCTDTDTELCLNDSRYQVEVEWRDFKDQTGSGQVAPLRSEDSGLLWFFSANNWEMLVKVLDGCGFNDNVWVFAAATTDVEYTLRVTDTSTGVMREYFNPLGQAAPAVTDTGAFACNPMTNK